MEKVILLESGKCCWRKCIFCGYSRQGTKPTNVRAMKVSLDRALLDFEGGTLKVFSSGSFLDREQFPVEFVDYFAQKCREKKVKSLIIESRPEFITKEALSAFSGVPLTVAIGLEVADNALLAGICKGFTVEDYVTAAKVLHESGCKVRTYLLANVPGSDDIKKSLNESVAFAKKHSDSIVVINLLPHGKAPLFDMWLDNKWSPLSKPDFRELTAGLEGVELDEETFRFVPLFPQERKEFIEGAGEKQLTHRYYNAWQDYISHFYETPEGKDIALFLPCSAKKPYAHSKTHTLIWKAIKGLPNFKRIHRIVISSPGVIPFEFSNHYPFNAYEWDERKETPEIKKRYIEVNKGRIMEYLKAHGYKHCLCFFKYSAESYIALKQACEELGIDLTNCLSKEAYEKYKDKNPLFQQESLDGLADCLCKLD